jgi:16S rRNA (cytidine1402-2'-O)-methyltransferase
MPSTSPSDNRPAAVAPGTLYVVATPIGNLEDITLRALAVLRAVDLVAAEDTRKTALLMRHFGISVPLISYHEHNETARTPELLRRLEAGAAIALVTTAGTPCISDPGYRIVAAAAAAGRPVVPVPGPSAAAAALSAAGLPTDAFVFEGFLSKKAGRRAARLKALAAETRTLILYESPQRIVALLESMLPEFGNRPAVLARELTKRYEEFVRGGLGDILATVKTRSEIKGECTLLVAGRAEEGAASWADAREDIRRGLASGSKGLSDLAREVAHTHGLPRQAVYEEALRLKSEDTGLDSESDDSPNA